MTDPLELYVAARDKFGLTNSAVARISTEAGEPLDQKSLNHWCRNGTGKTSWLLVVRALNAVGIVTTIVPVKGFQPPEVRPAGRPKKASVS